MSRTNHARPARRAAVPAVKPTPAQTPRQELASRIAQTSGRMAIAASIMAAGDPARIADARLRVKTYATELDQLLDAEERAAQDEEHAIAEATA